MPVPERTSEQQIGDAISDYLAQPPRLTGDAFRARLDTIIANDPDVVDRMRRAYA